jgi:hypothetical protein
LRVFFIMSVEGEKKKRGEATLDFFFG